MTLVSTRALTKMSYRDISLGGKGARCLALTTLATSRADRLVIMGISTSWSPKGLARPVMGWLDLSAVPQLIAGLSRCRTSGMGLWVRN